MSQKLKEQLQHQEVLATVGGMADDLGLEAYAVGGIVRDSLLDRPTSEIDFVTVGEGSGIALAESIAESQGVRMSHVYKNFGTAGVSMQTPSGPIRLEFVGARKESYRRDSRKPIVEDGSLSDDLRRRDFTVNAMAVEVNYSTFGSLHDPFDGLSDLDRKLLRTPLEPDATFDDDPLRMVRAARFASQLRFEVDTEALDAMSRNAERMEIVSQERVTDELRKILCSGSPAIGMKILQSAGILPQIFPEFSALAGVQTVGGYRHKDNFFHTLQVVDNLIALLHPDTFDLQIDVGDPEEWLRWAALLHDVGKPRTRRFETATGWTFHGHEDVGSRMIPHVFRQMKLPLDDRMKFVEKMVRLHHRPVSLVDGSVTDSAVRRLLFDGGDDIEDLMTLVRADITTKDSNKVQRYLNNFDRVDQKMVEVEQMDRLRNFQPPLDGAEIMDAIGLGEGVAVGIIKQNVREAILDGRIANEHDAAYDLMMDIKDDAVMRANVFETFVRSLEANEKRVIGAIKELIFFGDLPTEENEVMAFLKAAKNEMLAGAKPRSSTPDV